MQNVSTVIGRPIRVRAAVILALLALAAAAVAAVEAPSLINGSAPAKPASSTPASVRAVGPALAAHNRSEEGLGSTTPALGGQPGDSQPVRGPF
jgi:hypothetical protein